jgi:hypothetical protein
MQQTKEWYQINAEEAMGGKPSDVRNVIPRPVKSSVEVFTEVAVAEFNDDEMVVVAVGCQAIQE